MNGLKRNSLLFSLLIFLFFSCATQQKSFLYQGEFFKKDNSQINYPYQLTIDIANDFYPAISPDGKYIIYVSDKTGNLDLWLYDILSRNNYRITYHSSDDSMPAFSANGKKVVFISFRNNGRGDIFQLDFNKILDRCQLNLSKSYIADLLKNDGSRPLTQNTLQETEPCYWGNRYILYVKKDTLGRDNIFKQRDKWNAKSEPMTFSGATSPCISPNQQYIAYINISTNQKNKNHVFLKNIKSGETIQITKGNTLEARPQFISDQILIYASIRIDSNKNNSLDLNDYSSLFIYDLKTREERQLTPNNYISYYPTFSPIYNGVVIYTSTILNNVDLWMLPLKGYLPDLQNYFQEYHFINNLKNDYLKLMGYNNLLNYSESDANMIDFDLSKIYQNLGYTKESTYYLLKITNSIIAKTETIINRKANLNLKFNLLNNLKANTNLTYREKYYINLKLSELSRENKQFDKSIPLLEEIIEQYPHHDEISYKALQYLAEDDIQFDQLGKLNSFIHKITNYIPFKESLVFQKKLIELYLNNAVDKEKGYEKLILAFKNNQDFYNNILLHYISFLKNKNEKKALNLIQSLITNSSNPYFKSEALNQLYEIQPLPKYLMESLAINPESSEAKKILIDMYLKQAKESYSQNNFIVARENYQKVIEIDKNNIAALTGSLRCDFNLLKPDEKKYNRLINKLQPSSEYDYIYHYLQGYGYSLVYSYFYIQYKKNLILGEPGIFKKAINIFKRNRPLYLSEIKKKLKHYFTLSEEKLKIAYRVKPDFIEDYLILGWLYQIHSDVDKNNSSFYIENSIPIYQSALHFNEEKTNPEIESILYLNLGNNYFSLNNYSQALQCYNKKMEYQKDFQSDIQKAFYHFHSGYCYWFLENNTDALVHYHQSYSNFLNLQEYNGAYSSLIFLAMLNKLNNNFSLSLSQYQSALSLLEKQQLPFEKERLLREIGVCYQNLNDRHTALQFLFIALDSIPYEPRLGWLARWWKNWWERPSIRINCLDLFEIPIFPLNVSLGDYYAYYGYKNKDEKKLLFSLISDTYENFLDYKKAIQYLLLKKELLEEDKNKDALPYLYNQLGILYYKLNYFTLAEGYFNQSNKLLKKNKNLKEKQGIIINNLNLIEIKIKQKKYLLSVKEFNQIKSLLEDSITLCIENKYSVGLKKTYSLYGGIYLEQELLKKDDFKTKIDSVENIKLKYYNFIQALNYFNKAKKLANQLKDIIDEIKINYNIALIYYYTQDFITALNLFQQTLRDANKYLISDIPWKSQYFIVKINSLLHPSTQQKQEYGTIIKHIEKIPKSFNYNINNDPLIENSYNEFIDYLLSQSHKKLALTYLEKKKNFKIKEIFFSYPFDFPKEDQFIINTIKQIEQNILLLHSAAQKDLTKKFDNKKLLDYETQIESLYKQKDGTLKDLIKNNNPLLAYYLYSTNLKIALPSQTNVFLEFYISKTNLNVFIIQKTNLDTLSLPIRPNDFSDKLKNFNIALIKNNDLDIYKDYFNQTFIKKISQKIKNPSQITIIPDTSLFNFPFSLFFTNALINYDISLIQNSLHNPSKIFDEQLRCVLNSDSKLFALNTFPLNNSKISSNDFISIWNQSPLIHIPDKFQFQSSINYDIIYNEKNSFSIEQLIPLPSHPQFLSFEQCPKNFSLDEISIYTLLLPLYYMTIPSININYYDVKENYRYNFWKDFYQNTNSNFKTRYRTAYDHSKKINQKYYHQWFYGEFPHFSTSPVMTNTSSYTTFDQTSTITNHSVSQTNILTHNHKYVRDYSKEISHMIESNISFPSKQSQINNIMTNSFTSQELQDVISLVSDFYENSLTNLYATLLLYKTKKYMGKETVKSQEMQTNSLLVDFSVLNKKVYCMFKTKNERIIYSIKKSDLTKYFNQYIFSISRKDDEEYQQTKSDLWELLFNKSKQDLNPYSVISIFPDDYLFFLPFHFIPKSILSRTNNKIYVVSSYKRKDEKEELPLKFQGYGIQLNPSGKVILDFSYKEMESLSSYFPTSLVKLNPDKIIIPNQINALHLALPYQITLSNIHFPYPLQQNENSIMEEIQKSKLNLLVLTKPIIQQNNVALDVLIKMKIPHIIFALWRNNDAIAALWIDQFYYYLKKNNSVYEAFINTKNDFEKKYSSPLLKENFFLIY